MQNKICGNVKRNCNTFIIILQYMYCDSLQDLYSNITYKLYEIMPFNDFLNISIINESYLK